MTAPFSLLALGRLMLDSTETAMTTTHGQGANAAALLTLHGGSDDPGPGWRPRQDPGRGLGLPVAAADPEVDPCDIACNALPARSAGDLDPIDEAWLQRHAAECGYCRRQLESYDRLCGVLDACCAPPPVAVCIPPSVALPKASPVRSVRRRARVAVSPAWWTTVASPVGPLRLAASERGLAHISFAASESEGAAAAELERRGFDARPADEAPPGANDVLARARTELDEYFAGRRHDFDLPLDWSGVSPFTLATLEATAAVPFGRLDTYGSIADRIGKPGASRAVGNALGANPLPVIVPCHRIVAAGGAIGGYTGGLGIKQRLLAIEGVTIGL
jgi:methylated-DNA-[protein]-cysteine S-methyltransferase